LARKQPFVLKLLHVHWLFVSKDLLLISAVWLGNISREVVTAVLTGKSLANITDQSIPDFASLNSSSFPDPDTRTSEDCLFLDVVVPLSVYSNRGRSSFGGSGGGKTE
jgi:hypothetical protein